MPARSTPAEAGCKGAPAEAGLQARGNPERYSLICPRPLVSRLKPGGRIVYSTCSIEPEENVAVVEAVLAERRGFEQVEEHRHVPGQPCDGGYQALIRASGGSEASGMPSGDLMT